MSRKGSASRGAEGPGSDGGPGVPLWVKITAALVPAAALLWGIYTHFNPTPVTERTATPPTTTGPSQTRIDVKADGGGIAIGQVSGGRVEVGKPSVPAGAPSKSDDPAAK